MPQTVYPRTPRVPGTKHKNASAEQVKPSQAKLTQVKRGVGKREGLQRAMTIHDFGPKGAGPKGAGS